MARALVQGSRSPTSDDQSWLGGCDHTPTRTPAVAEPPRRADQRARPRLGPGVVGRADRPGEGARPRRAFGWACGHSLRAKIDRLTWENAILGLTPLPFLEYTNSVQIRWTQSASKHGISQE